MGNAWSGVFGGSADPPLPVDYNDSCSFRNDDGQRLFTRCWPSEKDKVCGLVFMCHGYGEHCGREGYETLASQLVPLGLTVFAHDHVSHGRSEGVRIDVEDFDVYVRDAIQHIKMKRQEIPDVPLYIVGHSMGGAIGLLAAVRQPELVNGLVLSAPALELFPHQTGFMATYALPVLATLLPYLVIVQPCPTSWLTRDEQQIERSKFDPCYYPGGSRARWCNNFVKALQMTQGRLSDVKQPFLVIHGTNDKLTNIEGSRRLVLEAKSKDKTLKEIPDAVHSLLHEIKPCQQEVIETISNWIEAHIESE